MVVMLEMLMASTAEDKIDAFTKQMSKDTYLSHAAEEF